MSPLLEEWLSLFENVKRCGERWYYATCPHPGHEHGDATQSLAVSERGDGKIVLKCWLGHDGAEIAKIVGRTVADLYPDQREKPEPRPTLADLAWDKRLPKKRLVEEWGLEDNDSEKYGRSVVIPYYDAEGRKLFVRYRVALHGKNHTRQAKGQSLAAYGLWKLKDARNGGATLFLVEGESDTWTLWHHGFPAVGLPGADTAAALDGGALEGFSTLYVWRENDAGGRAFVLGLAERLKAIGWSGEAWVIHGGAVKDPNALHQRGPEGFKEAIGGIIAGARRIGEVVAGLAQETAASEVQEAKGDGKNRREKSRRIPDVVATDKASLQSPPAAPGFFGLTDTGNAERLVFRHGRDIRYCHQSRKWLIWDGTRWAEDASGEIDRRMAETARSIYAEASQVEDRDFRQQVLKHAENSEMCHRLSSAVELARSKSGVPIHPAELDADPWRFNVLNGTVDLRTGDLSPHRREDKQSKRVDVVFDKGVGCPIWLAFLTKIMGGSPELVEFLQLAVGYSLTGVVREKCFFFLYGSGDNGKSTFIETLNLLLGDYFRKTTADTVLLKRYASGIPNDLARLAGIRFVSTPEIAENRPLDEARVKDMTGKDTMSARFLHAEWFDFKPVFKLWMYGNHKPVIRGADDGIWKRVRLVPFNVTIPKDEQDPELGDKLQTELSGILNWAVVGCLRWQREGLPAPAGVRDAIEDYRQEMDVVAAFLTDCCLITTDSAVTVAPTALYEAYEAWSKGNGDDPIGSRLFATKMKTKGFKQKKGSKGHRAWQNVALLLPPDQNVHESNGHSQNGEIKGLRTFDR